MARTWAFQDVRPALRLIMEREAAVAAAEVKTAANGTCTSKLLSGGAYI